MKKIILWLALLMAALMGPLTMRAAGAAEIVLGAGDVLRITVYGSPDLATETRVADSGTVTVPLVGQVPVAGLSVPAAEKKIASLLDNGGYVKKAQVNILVTTIQSQQVSVL